MKGMNSLGSRPKIVSTTTTLPCSEVSLRHPWWHPYQRGASKRQRIVSIDSPTKTEQSDLVFHLMFYHRFITPHYQKTKKKLKKTNNFKGWGGVSVIKCSFHLQQHPHDVIVVTSPFRCNTNCFKSACPILPYYFYLFLWYYANLFIIPPRWPWETLCGSLLWLFLQLLKEFKKNIGDLFNLNNHVRNK